MRKLPPNEYNSLHKYIARHLTKTGICIHCKLPNKTEWSNKSGNYLDDFTDWQELCRKCHRKYDTTVLGQSFGRAKGTLNGVNVPLPDWFIQLGDELRAQIAAKQ